MKGLLLTYGFLLYGLVIALVNPFRGLLVFIGFSIVKPAEMWFWSVPQADYSKFLLAAVLVGWLGKGCGGLRFGRGGRVLAFLIAFLAWSIFGALLAKRPDLAWTFVDNIWKIVLPCVVGLTLLKSTKQLRELAWVIAGCTGFVSLEMNLSYLGGYNRLRIDGFAGMDNNSAAIALVTGLGVAAMLALRGSRGLARNVAWVLTTLILHAVLISFSRGAMLATIIACGVAFLVIPKTPKTTFGFAVLVIAGTALAGAEVQARFATALASGEERDASAQSRLDLWADCWDVMAKNPIFGAGPDHWPTLAASYGWPAGKEAHSMWLQIGAELGFPGLFLLGAFFVTAAIGCWRVVKTSRSRELADPWLVEAARIVVVSLAGYVVAVQFVSLEALEVPYYVAMMGAGVLRLAHARSPVVAFEPSFEPSASPALQANTVLPAT